MLTLKRRSGIGLLAFSLLFPWGLNAQEWKLSLDQADSLFLSRNLHLLAAEIQIEANRALEIQARAYPNPQFEFVANLRDPENDRWMHWGPTGQKIVGLEQVILLGGKRRLEWKMAAQDTRRAEWELEDLLRHLRFQMRAGFYRLHQLGRELEVVEKQIEQLRPIRAHYSLQVEKGNIALKEALRLESVYLDLYRKQAEAKQELQDVRKDMAILLHDQRPFSPVMVQAREEGSTPIPSLDSLIRLARERRPDYRLAQWEMEQAKTRLQWEKVQRIPDLTVLAQYDQMGGAFGQEINLGVAVPLPIWNRNRGNIRARTWEVLREEYQMEAKALEVEAEVRKAWARWQDCLAAFEEAEGVFDQRYEQVLEGMTQSLLNRHLSLMEFVDFLESYQESRIHYIQFHHDLLIATESLNHAVAEAIR